MQFTLVAAGPHHVRYLAYANDVAGTIQFTGAGDADVALEDAVVAGPLKEIIGAAVFNAAEARRLGLDDGLLAGIPDISNGLGRAVTTVTKRDGAAGEWGVDADDNEAERVEINVVSAVIESWSYVEILFRHSYTQR